jgi:hypothetical protein
LDNAKPRLPVRVINQKTGKTLTGNFFCTLYYTPRETGFRANAGFDTSQETRDGLLGRYYGRDFLRAVMKEGFARLERSVNGKNYIKYDGAWGYADHPLGNRGNKLVARKSCAVSTLQSLIPGKGSIRILSPTVRRVFGSEDWEVSDTGGGIKPEQIDLYWGEDDPRAPGRHIARPKGTSFEFAYDITIIVPE